MRAGRPREANAIWNTAKAAHPGDPFVHGALAGTEPAAPAPATAMFASAQSWARTLSAPVEVPADALALQQIRDDEHAISAVLPAAFKKESMGGPGIKFANGDVNIVFMRIPRMTYCEGLACLDQLIPTFQLQGFKKQWRRVLTTPVGPGAEALLTTAGRGLLVAAIPAGGDIYFLMAGGAMDQMAAQVNALRMAYRTFRPLGLVLPQPVAGRLLPYYAAGDHRSQLQERLATATPSAIARGCPLRAVIDATDAASTRRGLLLDAFLTTPWSATRLRLLDCEAGGPLSPALTIAGLWDDDRAVRKAAAARAAADPGGVLTEAKRLMSGDVPIEPGAGSTGASHNHRWLQLLLSLPPKERGELARALLRRDEPHLRAVGLLAPRFCEVDLGRELHRIVRDGATADVRIALRAFPEELGPPLRDAVWARFDRARAPLADAEKTLLFDLGEQLARAPAAGDRARLERLLRLVSSGAARRQPAAVADQLKVEALLHPAPRSRAALPAGGPIPAADRPLSRLLPGNRWSYFSLPRPDLLLSRLGRLGRRLKASSRERQTLSQAVVSRVIAEASSVAADPGGIDLGRPIECAAPDGRMGDLICAAALRPDGPDDPGDMLRALGVIQMVTGGAVVLPVMLPGLPFILHDSVYRRPESTGAGQRTALVRESADQSLDTPAGALTWTTAIDISSDGAGDVDDKIVLRSKNRLLFSNAPALARRFLIPAGTAGRPAPAPAPAPTSLSSPSSPPPLAEDPDFVRASGRFVEGADLTAVVVNSEPGQTGPRGAVALEMTITTRGMAARVRLPFRQGGLDHRAGALARALPKGPALLFGAGEIDWGSDGAGQHAVWPDAMSLPPADDAGVAPPTWLGAVTGALAFGWYPRAGGHFWDSWIGIVTWDDKVAAAWRRHGMPEPSRDGKPSVSDGYRFQLAGQTLLVANDQALLDEAARKQAAGAAAGAEEPVTGLFDGGRVASSLEDIAERAPSKDAGMTLRSWAALASVVKSATLSSTVDRQRGEVVIESLLSPEMEGATPTALVDEWVAESRIRNTLMLPRALPPSDGGKPIRFTLDVEHDKNFTRAFPTTARQQVERVGQGHWRVSVSPSPRIDQPVRAETMSAGERTRWLDAENVSPRIASAAREIIPDKTDSRQAAQLVLAWMKRNMTYELTPRDVSDETILERRRGDCSEYSKLAVALLRARGIPARTRSGFLAESATLVAHAWVEFFDGTGWREIDPVAGTASVDARHIDASVADVLSLLSLAQIRVAGVE
jgi:hypothetical protein